MDRQPIAIPSSHHRSPVAWPCGSGINLPAGSFHSSRQTRHPPALDAGRTARRCFFGGFLHKQIIGPIGLISHHHHPHTTTMPPTSPKRLDFFERNLSLWVLLCMAGGIALGKRLPEITDHLARFEEGQTS